MEIRQVQFAAPLDTSSSAALAPLAALKPHLVLVFASTARLSDPRLCELLRSRLGDAQHVGCSSAGEISSSGVADDSVVMTAIRFKDPAFRVACVDYAGMDDTCGAGQRLAAALKGEGLHAILLLAQGVNINGSALIDGVASVVGAGVTLVGGLAADGGQFTRTWTLCNGTLSDQQVVGIGFYGNAIQVTHGSYGGWQPFGATRLITRAKANVLYELDGEPALEIYRRYLGDYARDLPGSGLLFPFAMLGADQRETGLIRSILGVDESTGSLTLAGDVAEGSYLRLMTASNDALVNGAEVAANMVLKKLKKEAPYLALLISCVGRKLLMGARVEEEVEAVSARFGPHARITGFYSNGEISPYASMGGVARCQLHNQTMTITCLSD